MESEKPLPLNDRQSEWTNHPTRDLRPPRSVESPATAISEISWLRFVSGHASQLLATTRRWQLTLTRTWQRGKKNRLHEIHIKLQTAVIGTNWHTCPFANGQANKSKVKTLLIIKGAPFATLVLGTEQGNAEIVPQRNHLFTGH